MKFIRMLRSAATRYIVDRAMACSCSLLTSPMAWPISGQAVSARTLCCDYRECRFVCAPQAGFRPAHQCRKPVGECFACMRVSTRRSAASFGHPPGRRNWAGLPEWGEPTSCIWSSTPSVLITPWSCGCINLRSARRAAPLELKPPGDFLVLCDGSKFLPSSASAPWIF